MVLRQRNLLPYQAGEIIRPKMNLTKTIEYWKSKARELKVQLYALYLAYRDPRTPWYAKVFAALVVGYAFSPIDLIPDFIPVLGYLDDLILVPLGVLLAKKMIPVVVMEECQEKARKLEAAGTPVNYVAAAIIVLFWVLIVLFVGINLYRWLGPSRPPK
jgi:uncharacterized membrane protein YkvA (DUF1232 family)